MRLFNAGIFAGSFHRTGNVYAKCTPEEQIKRDSCKNYLESYHYIHKQIIVERIRADGVKVFLDSGAFSAFTQGISVDIGAYCDYIHRNQDIIEFASVLDAIGDHKGTWKNQAEMERRGVQPLPCFHYGEPEEVLEYYIANYPYITIGGMVPISTPQLRVWLDRLWTHYLTNEDGTPKLKVHGFGLTSLPLMMRYPWYSVDSSTWVQWALNGMILIPSKTGQVSISAQSSMRKIQGQHIDNLPELVRQEIEDEIKRMDGDPDRLRETYVARWSWNIWAFPEYAKSKTWESDRLQITERGLFA